MKIDVWSDVICPFCYIGKRRLELALEQTGIDADVEWHSFELNANAPESYGTALPEVMNTLYGLPRPRALQVLAHEEGEANSVGLQFNWRDARPGNTFDAHRLIHLGTEKGIGDRVKERFLRAYFTEGEEIGSHEVLRRIALDTDLEADEVDDVLGSDRFARDVRADEQRAVDLGVRGVPYFVVNDRATMSGAQSVETFVALLRDEQAREEQEGADGSSDGTGGVCHDGFCEINRG